jgi:hypothetical protein
MVSTERRGATGRGWYLLTVGAPLALVPLLWWLDDAVLRSATLLAAASSIALVIRRELKPVDPAVVYDAALTRAVGVRVELTHARVVAVHDKRLPAHVMFTWREAVTTLLDADCRPLAEQAGNGLTTCYMWSVPIRDDDVVARLASEHALGRVSVYAVTDLAMYPHCNLRDDGFVVEQHDIAFPGWSATVRSRREELSWDL